jgi:DNA-binding GntR family transcriptional regulator
MNLHDVPMAGMPDGDIYNRLVQLVFSGELPPGTKLVERDLARQLDVSRIPVRESLGKMVAQGLLVGGEKWQGVRMRNYTTDDLRQLYEFRELLEGGAARAAARAATDADIERLRMICDQMESEVGRYGSQRWAELDHRFHYALSEASHNERIVHSLKLLLTECHYVFYLYPARRGRPKPSKREATAHMQSVLDDHRELLRLVRTSDAEGAEKKARADMVKSGRRATRALIAMEL